MPMVPQTPIVKFFSPQKSDQGLIELHDTTTAAYLPLDEGAPHENTRDYPGFKLGKQFNLPDDHKWLVRIWVTDEVSPVWWNWSQKFVSESDAHPIFVRQFRELRNTYAAHTKLQPLKSVYKLSLTAAGSGYTPETQPALAFSNGGTGGSGAVGHAVVNKDGTIAELVLDDGGSGYNTAPTFTIKAPPSGTTATGTAAIQPATALLVAEQADQFPPDSEFYGLYLNVVRVYQTLPGPVLQGQDRNRQFSIVIPFTEQEIAAGTDLGDANSEITPIDSARAKKKTVDVTALHAFFDTYLYTFADVADIPLPDVLLSVTSIKNENYSTGGSSGAGEGGSTGDHGSYSVSAPVSNESAAALSFELNIKISSGHERGRNKPTLRGVVLMPEGFNQTDLSNHIQALLGLSVTSWPDFQPQLESLVATGMSVGVQTGAQTHVNFSFDSTANSHGTSAVTSFSHRVGINSGPVRISPTIHGLITVGGDGTSANRSVSSQSSSAISGTVAASADSGSQTATASAAISPTSLPATPGQSTYPTTGLKLLGQNAEPFMENYVMVHFELFDFGVIA